MQLADKLELWITYQVDIYLMHSRTQGGDAFAFSHSVCITVFWRYNWSSVWAHRRSLHERVRNKNMHKLHSCMNLQTSEPISLRCISQQTELEDEKSWGRGLQQQRWWYNLVLSFFSPRCDEHWALILLPPSALAFVCCHGKATLILIPVALCWFCAQTLKHAQSTTRIFVCMLAELPSCTCWRHNPNQHTHEHTLTKSQHTHLLFIVCKHEET